jgi:hypothetical protein
MSTDTDTTENAAPAAPVNPVVENMVNAGVAFIQQNVTRANELAQKIENQSNASRLVFEIRDDPDATDDVVKKYQAWRNKVDEQILAQQAKVEAHIRENLMPGDVSDVDIEAATKEYSELMATVKAMRSTIETISGSTPELPEIKAIPGVRKSSGGTGNSGIKRPRFSSVDVRVAGEQEYHTVSIPKKNAKGEIVGSSSNLTALMLYVNKEYKGKTTAKDFQEALFSAAGTQDIASKAGQEITFGYQVGDKNLEIRVIPTSAE